MRQRNAGCFIFCKQGDLVSTLFRKSRPFVSGLPARTGFSDNSVITVFSPFSVASSKCKTSDEQVTKRLHSSSKKQVHIYDRRADRRLNSNQTVRRLHTHKAISSISPKFGNLFGGLVQPVSVRCQTNRLDRCKPFWPVGGGIRQRLQLTRSHQVRNFMLREAAAALPSQQHPDEPAIPLPPRSPLPFGSCRRANHSWP